MTDHEALVRRYVDTVWNDADVEAAEGFLDPGFRRHVSAVAPPLDVPGQMARLRGFRAAFPDARVALEEVVVDGDSVAMRGIMTGTHKGEFLGIAPTGAAMKVVLLDLIHIRDGRLVEHWGGPDLNDLVKQLGGA